MPIPITLVSTPNQRFSILLDDYRFEITLRTLRNGGTVATIDRDQVRIVDSVQVVANRLVLPYRYMEADGGNFYIDGNGGTLPDWTQYGVTQSFLYLTAAELAALRNV